MSTEQDVSDSPDGVGVCHGGVFAEEGEGIGEDGLRSIIHQQLYMGLVQLAFASSVHKLHSLRLGWGHGLQQGRGSLLLSASAQYASKTSSHGLPVYITYRKNTIPHYFRMCLST